MKIICIGNSNVNGFPHKRSESWVSLLGEKMNGKFINKGVNGDTTQGILSRFEKDVIRHKPEKVIILTGTNDFIQGNDVKDVINNMNEMVEISKKANIEVTILTPLLTEPELASLLWIEGVDYNLMNTLLKNLREKMYESDFANKIDIIDLQRLFSGNFVDGIHPNKEGHIKIAEIVEKALIK